MKMHSILFLILFVFAAPVWSLDFEDNASLSSDLVLLKMDHYRSIGEQTSKVMMKSFVNNFSVQKNSGEKSLPDAHLSFEKWLIDYQNTLRQSTNMASKDLANTKIQNLVKDVNKLMKLKAAYNRSIHENIKDRKVFIQTSLGLNAKLEALENINIGQSKEQITSLRNYLVTQASLQVPNTQELCFEDLWWNLQSLRSMRYPIDLVSYSFASFEKLKTQVKTKAESLTLARASLAYMSVYLRTGSLLHKESEAKYFVSVINQSMSDFSALGIKGPLENLRVQKYKWLMKSGETLDAQFVRSQIAWDQIRLKFGRIASANSFADFLYFSFTFLIYVIGYIFVATPIELFVILAAVLILAKQGRDYFKIESDIFNWKKPKTYLRVWINTLKVAWKMFVTSYTGSTVPFYSKVASSLLLFGIGLLFNGARLILESMVNQLAL